MRMRGFSSTFLAPSRGYDDGSGSSIIIMSVAASFRSTMMASRSGVPGARASSRCVMPFTWK